MSGRDVPWLVRWYDHAVTFGPRPRDMVPEPYVQTSVGFLIHEGPLMLSLASTINHDDEPCEVLDLLVSDVITKYPLFAELERMR